jgi:hypothetical protein
MSRLDSHIRQKIAQRACIDLAAQWLAGEPGIIVEFGLGTGRSYSHLRQRFPRHDIFCFDRLDRAHPGSRPPADHLVLGEFSQVLADPANHTRFAGQVILAHLDIGNGTPEDDVVPELILDRVHGWLKPGAIVLSDLDLSLEPAWRLDPIDPEAQVEPGARYYVYRRLPD